LREDEQDVPEDEQDVPEDERHPLALKDGYPSFHMKKLKHLIYLYIILTNEPARQRTFRRFLD
jgi:hypothetical protein